jgi:hypothetical protein
MSFRAPRPPKRTQGASASSAPPSSSPSPAVSSRSASPTKTPTKARVAEPHLATPAVPRGRKLQYTKNLVIPDAQNVLSLPGQEYVQVPSSRPGHSSHLTPDSSHRTTPAAAHVADNCGTDDFDVMEDFFVMEAQEHEDLRPQRQQRKKEKQWQKWTGDVIPSLLHPHLELHRESQSLRSVPQSAKPHCTCHGSAFRRLKVVCVTFERECCLHLFSVVISSPSEVRLCVASAEDNTLGLCVRELLAFV